MSKKVIVCGAGGFIGTHLVTSLKQKGCYVVGADIKYPEYSKTDADEFYLYDLTDQSLVDKLLSNQVDEIYQLAADMGGAGYVFTGNNDAHIMQNSATINLNILRSLLKYKTCNKIFYSSSACAYPAEAQTKTDSPALKEEDAYPANPDSEYGWEKLFSERLYMSHARNHGLQVRIARFHNIFGPLGSWNNGKEKSPAAICRKVAEATDEIEVWGDGTQTRSFLYVDECVYGIHQLMASSYDKPLNLGSDRQISINELAAIVAKIAGKSINIKHVPGPRGVVGRCSDNGKIQEVLGWKPKDTLEYGLTQTYNWILSRFNQQKG